jgi:hypothetical protein
MRESEDCRDRYAQRPSPRDDFVVREWLRVELQRRYDDTLAAPLPDDLLELLPLQS